ncbi:MAG: GMC oxidoreductase [Bacteroidia bacterium]
MLKDGSIYSQTQTFKTNICIIGAGAAGISIALRLLNTDNNIILLESGGISHNNYGESLNKGFVAHKGNHEPLEKYRRRTIGGTTSAWGGRCIPFDQIDFEQRDYVPFSGWPFGRQELDAYYHEANTICEAGSFNYRSNDVFPEKQSEIIPGFDTDLLTSDALERWSPPTHFGKRYLTELTEAQNLDLLYNLTCNHIQLTENGQHIKSVQVKGPNGVAHTIEADQFILAGGCIENTRMLLASNDVHPNGIGNHYDALGRYYMAHLWGITTKVKLNKKALEGYIHNFERDKNGVYIRRRFALSEKAQKELGVLNVVGFFFRPEVADADHNDPIMSIIHLMKEGPSTLLKSKWDSNSIKHLNNVMKGFPRVVSQIIEISRQRKKDRRLPYVITPKNAAEQHFYYQSEQAPNPSSRISLHPTEKDKTGLPRAAVNLQFKDIDLQTVKVFHQQMSERFKSQGLGEFDYNEAEIEKNYNMMAEDFDSGSHHLGSTRISEDPRMGVIDKDCKVHGVSNLYVAGASVFPTGSHANPTLTIVALALRLADNLLKKKETSVNYVVDKIKSSNN